MKKILLLLICMLLISGVAMAEEYTVTVKVEDSELVLTHEPGKLVELDPKIEIMDWEVEEGHIELNENKFTMVSENVVVKAIPKYYTVQYKLNGGSGDFEEQTKEYDIDLRLDSDIPQKTGSTFLGWSVSSGSTSVSYNAGDTYSENASVTLYAVWQEEQFVLTVNPGGTQYSGSYGEDIEITAPLFEYTVTFKYENGEADTSQTVSKVFEAWEPEAGEFIGSLAYETERTTTYTFGLGSETIIASYADPKVQLPTPTRDGYVLDGWYKDDDTKVGVGGSYYTVTEDITLTARWMVTIDAIYNQGGSIEPEGTGWYNLGESVTYYITPNEDYKIAEVKVDNISKGVIESYAFNNLAMSHTIEATFEEAAITITAEAGEGGSISPSGITSYEKGSSATYTMTPNEKYKLVDLLVDDVSVGAKLTYTFENLTENHTIKAVFEPVASVYVIAEAGYGGTITPSGTKYYEQGTSATYKIAATVANYKIKDVLVDNVSVGARSSYTFKNLTENHTISVTFGEIGGVITSQAGDGGGITPEGPKDIFKYDDQSYEIVADSGNVIYKIIVDGESIEFTAGSEYTYTFTNVVASHTIRAIFAESGYESNTYNLTVNPNGGSYSGNTSNTVHSGLYGSSIELINPVHQNFYTVTFNENEGICAIPYLETKDFSYWDKNEEVGEIVYNDNNKATYTFGPRDVEIIANYRNDDITLPDATRLGYTLDGWYTAASGGTKVGTAGDTYTAPSNITLYAQWKANTTINLTYNSNYSTSTTIAVSIPKGSKLPQNTFARDGYAFTGWNTKSNGSGTAYLDREIYDGASGITLYAQWTEATEYLVTVESDSGVTTSGNQKVGERVVLNAEDFTEDGHRRIISWSSSDVELTATTGLETSFIMPANAVTVYQTTEDPPEEAYTKYTLIISTDGYEEVARKVSPGEYIELTATPRDTESALAWEANGVTLSNYYGMTTSFTMPSNDAEVRMIPGKYILTAQILEESINEQHVAGETITLTAPYAVGQSFVGWEAIEGLEIAEEDVMNTTLEFNMPYNNVNIRANYETYTVTTKLVDVTMSGAQTAGEKVTITANKIEGLTFSGWTVTGLTEELDPYAETIEFTMPYNDVSFVGNYLTYTMTSQVDSSGKTVQNITAGTEITLTAVVKAEETFLGWKSDEIEIKDPMANEITFIMPRENIEVIAMIGQYLLSVDCGSLQISELKMAEQQISITAPVMEGQTFDHWTVEGIELANTTSETISFSMPYNSVTLVGNYVTYTLTSQLTSEGPTTVNMTAGTNLTLTATELPGDTFLEWQVENITVDEDDLKKPVLEFEMPRQNATALAIFGQYVLHIESAGMYFEGLQKAETPVKVTANEVSGMTFTGWTATGLPEGVDTSQLELTFDMPYGNVELIANYELAE